MKSSQRRTGLTFALVIMGLAPLSPMQAQQLPISLSNLQYSASINAIPIPSTLPELGDSTKYPRTYWLEGALLGGIPLGILGAALGGGLCADPDSPGGGGSCVDDALLGLATGFGVGGSLGGLIGGMFKKPAKKEQETLGDKAP